MYSVCALLLCEHYLRAHYWVVDKSILGHFLEEGYYSNSKHSLAAYSSLSRVEAL